MGEEEGEDVGGGEKGGLSQSFPQKAGYSPTPPSDWALWAAEKMIRALDMGGPGGKSSDKRLPEAHGTGLSPRR